MVPYANDGMWEKEHCVVRLVRSEWGVLGMQHISH